MVNFTQLAISLAALLPLAAATPVPQGQPAAQPSAKYIVALKPGAHAPTHMRWVRDIHSRSLSKRDTAGVQKTYKVDNLEAYAGEFDASTVAQIKKNPDVAVVEQDQIWTIPEESVDVKTRGDVETRDLVTQKNAPWGLGAISSTAPGSTDYIYDSEAGQGTWAYVIDTGIRLSHSEFAGRAAFGFNSLIGSSDKEMDTHGTHVAGTIAGSTVGVAKKANIVSVKIYGQGIKTWTSDIINGYNFAVKDIRDRRRTNKAVINMSIDGPKSGITNDFIKAAYNIGVLTIAAAGNPNVDAASRSPPSAPNVVAVGSINDKWRQSSFSNWGKTVSIYAPGSDVKSAWVTSDSATKSISGTSMAAPHVAGVALSLMSRENLSAPQVVKCMKSLALKDKLTGLGKGSPNLLLNTGASQPTSTPSQPKGCICCAFK
ncbi:hypothetical protein PG990_004509 [Apiospora arundinis]